MTLLCFLLSPLGLLFPSSWIIVPEIKNISNVNKDFCDEDQDYLELVLSSLGALVLWC